MYECPSPDGNGYPFAAMCISLVQFGRVPQKIVVNSRIKLRKDYD